MAKTKNTKKTIQNPAYALGLLQGKAYARLNTSLSAFLSQFFLSIPEWKLLGQAYEHENVQLSTLADLLDYDPPMVTKLVKILEKKNLLERMPSEYDERAKVIVISTAGKKLIEKVDPQIKLLIRGLLSGITTEQLNNYIFVLQTIVKNSTP